MIRERVRKQIAYAKLAEDEGITVDGVPDYIKCEAEGFGLSDIEQALEFADQILAIKELAVVDRDAELPSLPKFLYDGEEYQPYLKRGAINYSKMLTGWVKEEK